MLHVLTLTVETQSFNHYRLAASESASTDARRGFNLTCKSSVDAHFEVPEWSTGITNPSNVASGQRRAATLPPLLLTAGNIAPLIANWPDFSRIALLVSV
jgi:hypothetical protein